jgi:hypothetical protein
MRVRVLHLNDLSPSLPVDQDLNSPHDREEQYDRELSLYRDRTVLLLRRYMRLSLEAGRLPSLLGRECFRTRFSAYLTHTFEDVVIFVHDVERSLEELDRPNQRLLAMIVLQEHSQEETAHRLGYARKTIGRRYAEALDRVSKIFLRKHIMDRIVNGDAARDDRCQEAANRDFAASDSAQAKYSFAQFDPSTL